MSFFLSDRLKVSSRLLNLGGGGVFCVSVVSSQRIWFLLRLTAVTSACSQCGFVFGATVLQLILASSTLGSGLLTGLDDWLNTEDDFLLRLWKNREDQ